MGLGRAKARRRERSRRRIRASHRLARRTVPAIAVLALAAGLPSVGARPSELVVEPELLTRLQTLAEGLHREVVLCLKGSSRGRVAVADDFVMPLPRLSTPTRSSFDRCPRGTLASWHNHPRSVSSVATVSRGAGPASPGAMRRLCVLSETDIRTASRLRHPFVVVSVDAATWCWWTLSEVDRFAEASISPAPPSPERIARGGAGAAWARPSTVDPD